MNAGKTRLMAMVGLAVLAIIWILQNGGSVQTKFLFFTMTVSQSALLSITMLVGIAAGILMAFNLSKRGIKKDK